MNLRYSLSPDQIKYNSELSFFFSTTDAIANENQSSMSVHATRLRSSTYAFRKNEERAARAAVRVYENRQCTCCTDVTFKNSDWLLSPVCLWMPRTEKWAKPVTEFTRGRRERGRCMRRSILISYFPLNYTVQWYFRSWVRPSLKRKLANNSGEMSKIKKRM